MPKTKVEIEWNKPKYKNWLNVYNIATALGAYCKNTKFKVRDLEPPFNVSGEWAVKYRAPGETSDEK